MKENPFAQIAASSDEEKKSAENLRIEVATLNAIAFSHLDELLSAEDWKKFGLDKVNPVDLEDFQWSVYVSESNGQKRVGVKILDADGLYDIREFNALVPNLPVSTKQQEIDEEAERRSLARHEREERARALEREKMDRERGFPEGRYRLEVTYPHRSGKDKTTLVEEVRVETRHTKDDVLRMARGAIQMLGIHNFGLITGERGIAEIQVVLKNQDGTKLAFPLRVDNSGHIVREKKTE